MLLVSLQKILKNWKIYIFCINYHRYVKVDYFTRELLKYMELV
jgi:hypothetical protein